MSNLTPEQKTYRDIIYGSISGERITNTPECRERISSLIQKAFDDYRREFKAHLGVKINKNNGHAKVNLQLRKQH